MSPKPRKTSDQACVRVEWGGKVLKNRKNQEKKKTQKKKKKPPTRERGKQSPQQKLSFSTIHGVHKAENRPLEERLTAEKHSSGKRKIRPRTLIWVRRLVWVNVSKEA